MADRTLKSLRFPGLSDTYRIPQLALEYDITKVYSTGDWCTYQGKTYRCLYDMAAAGAWNSAYWEEDHVGNHIIVPTVTAADNGKVLAVVNGAWVAVAADWTGTQAEYDALGSYDNNTTYYIVEAAT